MNKAQSIVDRFGGQTALAQLLEKHQSVVSYWCKTGVIPAKWHGKIIELGVQNHVSISPSDFIVPINDGQKPEDPNAFPIAKWQGILKIGELDFPVYVLKDGRRVISKNGASGLLTEKGSGDLDSYIRVASLRDYIPDVELIQFDIGQSKLSYGFEAKSFTSICKAYVKALSEGALKTETQLRIASRCAVFLSACSDVGFLALIDEATGYQYERAEDALRVKLELFLEEEMRAWEKTFPDELWTEFGRLTNWTGRANCRPKYWGKLVMELIYDNLDPDVSGWLKENAPKPKHGKNYHQWLSGQYGLQKLIQHIWMIVGMAKSCSSMSELRERVAFHFGKQPLQLTLYVPNR